MSTTMNTLILRLSRAGDLKHRIPRTVTLPRIHSNSLSFRHDSTSTSTSTPGSVPKSPPPPGPPPRPPPGLFTRENVYPYLVLLGGAGIGAIAYGVYDMYKSRTYWPSQMLRDLRSGLRAKHKNDIPVAVFYLQRAYDTSKTLPLADFGPDPHLKTSGVAICLADLLEADGKPEEAYSVYLDALVPIQVAVDARRDAIRKLSPGKPVTDRDVHHELSGAEKLRGIALAYKLGELAGTLNKPEEEEQHLVWAVETILPAMMPQPEPSLGGYVPGPELPPIESMVNADEKLSPLAPSERQAVLVELSLPEWASKTDFAAPFEALGTFYAQNGRVEYAVSLYLQAISILLPRDIPTAASSTEERCRAAQIMSNLSELLIRARQQRKSRHELGGLLGQSPTSIDTSITRGLNKANTNESSEKASDEIITQAEAWASKALEISLRAREERKKNKWISDPTCEVSYAVALFNVAALKRMVGDKEEAKEYFIKSLNQSKAIGMQEGIVHGEEALQQLEQQKGNRSEKDS